MWNSRGLEQWAHKVSDTLLVMGTLVMGTGTWVIAVIIPKYLSQ